MSQDRCLSCHQPFKKDRSNNQNRYYWGVVIKLLSEHTGFEPDEMHEVLKHIFLSYPKTLETKKPELVYISKSTSGLSTKDFEDFMSRVRTWASLELAVWIPEPNEEISL